MGWLNMEAGVLYKSTLPASLQLLGFFFRCLHSAGPDMHAGQSIGPEGHQPLSLHHTLLVVDVRKESQRHLIVPGTVLAIVTNMQT